MCEEGALDEPAVQRIFGLHVWPLLRSGTIASRPGTLLAAASSFSIVLTGTGGHAGVPHLAIDPIAAAAALVCALQSIVSRETDPLDAAVVSITAVHGGDGFNVIPSEVTMKGTLRSLTSAGLEVLKARVRDIAVHVAAARRCNAAIEFPGHDYPATVNDALCWQTARQIGREMLGDDAVREALPVMGTEDFAYYLNRIPGCFVFLGVGDEAQGTCYSVHHPKFKVDERALAIGAALHVAFALRSIRELA
jgi:IAA-amino acid hydrolase